MEWKQLTKLVEELAPLRYAYEWDNSGEQVRMHGGCEKLLICLEVTQKTLDEAIALGCDAILCHHPLLFKPVKKLDAAHPVTSLVLKAAAHGINIYAAHTSCDCAPGGVNKALADKLGIIEQKLFVKEGSEPFYKIVVFVPEDAQQAVRDALAEAGAAAFGSYEKVFFAAKGEGGFLPKEGANPAIGQTGREERVAEVRLECMCSGEKLSAAVAAARGAHPYEAPAIDIIALEQPAEGRGIGVMGRLEKPLARAEFLHAVKAALDAPLVRAAGGKDVISTVACIGGSGGDAFAAAAAMGVDALVTGEVKYNHFIDAAACGVLLAEAGHFDTEKYFVNIMAEHLQKRANELQYKIRICCSLAGERPYECI
ncbi:MAG: Nif3-like dinuclear metal center hexameric protein [Christensenellaceae bacterium]|nr:Nif3-like dinuclear metal center hexameric protein [Christensenellaceae bacterium]